MNAYRGAADPLDALGDATRRAIVEQLRGGERAVGDLAAGLPVSRPAVSQHLAVLRAAGLVAERPQGTRRYYRLDPAGLARLRDRLDAMWGAAARAPGLVAGRIGSPIDATPASVGAPVSPPAAAAGRPAAVTAAPPPAEAGGKARKKRKKKGGRR